jgi:hypothetical protein
MVLWRRAAPFFLLLSCCATLGTSARASPPVSLQADGSLQIDGRTLQCGNVRNALDRRLPNLGVSVPATRILIINPMLLARESKTVRVFVFNHECGHHHVGASELRADCWAVHRGVQEGWLDKAGLAQVCGSFHGAAATPTHPSGARRCSNLDRCFAVAESERMAAARSHEGTAASPGAEQRPRLVSGPRLVRDGTLR